MIRVVLLSTFAVLLHGNVAEAQPTSSESGPPALKVKGEGITPAQKNEFAEYFLSRYSITLKPLEGPALSGVIRGKIYAAHITENENGLTGNEQRILSYDGKAFKPLTSIDTNKALPDVLKLIDDRFKLKNDGDAVRFQAALDKLYPFDENFPDTIAKKIMHKGNRWSFVREKFIGDEFQGFVITTSADGTITKVEYSLEIK